MEQQNQTSALLPSSQNHQDLETYSHIELTDEETELALINARREKHCRIELEHYSQRIREEAKVMSMTPKQYWLNYRATYNIDDDNTDILRLLCLYFCNDKSFEDANPSFSLNKGILLFGPVGVGKSELMRFFMKNPKASYTIVSCRDIESRYSNTDGGEEVVRYYSGKIPVAINADPFGHKSIGICFDDLGTESAGKHFGKEKNVMTEIILNRYDNQTPRYMTHVTTNISIDDIEQFYGSRVRDRMREMFNVIQFNTQAKTRRR